MPDLTVSLHEIVVVRRPTEGPTASGHRPEFHEWGDHCGSGCTEADDPAWPAWWPCAAEQAALEAVRDA